MDPNLPNYQSTKSPTEQPGSFNSNDSRQNWVLTGVCLLIIILAGVLIFSYINKKASNPTSLPQRSTISGMDIAKQTAIFLQRAELPSGDFNQVYACAEKSCQISPAASSTTLSTQSQYNGFIAQAFAELYKKTKDTNYREAAKKALSFIVANCSKDSHWCTNSLPGLYAWYQETQDPQYKDAILKSTDNLLASHTLVQDVESQKSEFYSMNYEVTRDERIKNKIENVAKDIMADKVDEKAMGTRYGLLYKEGGFEVAGYDILASNWLIEAYKVTKDPIYLTAAQDFFDKAKIHLHTQDFKRADNIALTMNTLEYLLNLADVSGGTKKQAYVNQAHTFAQVVVSSLWDNTSNIKFNGDYGFLANFNHSTNFKISTLNGFRTSQFLRMNDKIFYFK